MSGLDLHPEDLIDKGVTGRLTAAERERFDRHLAACPTCRFELAARGDFQEPIGERLVEPRPRGSGKRPLRRLGVLALAAALFAGGSLAAILSRPSSEEPPVVHVATATSVGVASKGAVALPVRTAPAAPTEIERPTGMQAVAEPPLNDATVARAATPVSVNPSTAELLPAPRDSVTRTSSPPSAEFPGASPPRAAARVSESTTSRQPTAPELFRSANQARRDDDAGRAMALYRTLQAEYPDSEEARLSRATLAKLMLDRGEPRAALEGFDEYLAQGDVLLGEEALVGRALALQRLGSRKEEVLAWREVLRRFPRSVHARLASARLAALGKQ